METNNNDCFKHTGIVEHFIADDEFICHYYQQRETDVLHICLTDPDLPILNLLPVDYLRNSGEEDWGIKYEKIDYAEFYIKVKQVLYILDVDKFLCDYREN